MLGWPLSHTGFAIFPQEIKSVICMMYQKFFNKIRKSRRSEWIGAKQKDMQLSFFPSLNQSSAADKTGLSLILFCSLALIQQVLQIIFQLVEYNWFGFNCTGWPSFSFSKFNYLDKSRECNFPYPFTFSKFGNRLFLQVLILEVQKVIPVHPWPGSTPVLLVMFEKLDGGLPWKNAFF